MNQAISAHSRLAAFGERLRQILITKMGLSTCEWIKIPIPLLLGNFIKGMRLGVMTTF